MIPARSVSRMATTQAYGDTPWTTRLVGRPATGRSGMVATPVTYGIGVTSPSAPVAGDRAGRRVRAPPEANVGPQGTESSSANGRMRTAFIMAPTPVFMGRAGPWPLYAAGVVGTRSRRPIRVGPGPPGRQGVSRRGAGGGVHLEHPPPVAPGGRRW